MEKVAAMLGIVTNTCIKPKSKETALVICDNRPTSRELGFLLYNILKARTADTVISVIEPRSAGTEPPDMIANAMLKADIIICIAEKRSIAHTTARVQATLKGARMYIFLVEVGDEFLRRELTEDNLHELAGLTDRIAGILEDGHEVRVESPHGTNIEFSITGRKALSLNPFCMEFAIVPDYSEAAISPVEGSAEGVIVIDKSVVGWGFVLSKPLTCYVNRGRVTRVEGAEREKKRIEKILTTDENSNVLAEFAIGTNPYLPQEFKGTRWDSAPSGILHFGFGRNNDMGGETMSHTHFDVNVCDATVVLDGREIVVAGRLVDEK